MQRILIARRTDADQMGQARNFDYHVLVDEAKAGGEFMCESYGVQVSSCGGDEPEICAIPNITTSVQRIDELMERLVGNVVTPTTLRDVVDDWLGE